MGHLEKFSNLPSLKYLEHGNNISYASAATRATATSGAPGTSASTTTTACNRAASTPAKRAPRAPCAPGEDTTTSPKTLIPDLDNYVEISGNAFDIRN